MKTWFLIIPILTAFNGVFSQNRLNDDSKMNEVKLNTLFLVGAYPEISYERTLGKKSALGISLGAFIGSPKPNYATDILTADISILPYFRYYFGKRRNTGFFLESNVNISGDKNDFDNSHEWGLGVGLGLGCKFILNDTWSIGLVAGGGSNIVQEPCDSEYLCFPDVYSRLGITIGLRF